MTKLASAAEALYLAVVRHYENYGMDIPRDVEHQLSDVHTALYEERSAGARSSGLWKTSAVPVLPLAQAILVPCRDDARGVEQAWTAADGIRRHNTLTQAAEVMRTLTALGYTITYSKDLPMARTR